jgi:hypothetical protein
MVRILEFKEFKQLLEADETDAAGLTAPASEPPAGPPPPPTPEVAAPDFGIPPPDAAPVDAAPAEPTAEPTPADEMKFVFIQDAKSKKWHGHHGLDGGVKKFTQYSVTADEITKWLDVHKFDADKDVVMASLVGKREMPEDVYSTFKKEVQDGSLGSDKGSIDIKFDSDSNFNNPSTTDLNVVFLKHN